MATLGQALTSPESGWRRHDNTDSRIAYIGTWVSAVETGGYLNTHSYSNIIGNSFKFKFFGSKFRLIDWTYSDKSSNISVNIDGQDVGSFSEYGSSVAQALVYEKTSLLMANHVVIITNNTNKYLSLDAIDIDETGYLVHPTLNQMSNIDSGTVGDYIPCKYTVSSSGSLGYFSELGTCISNEIPALGSAVPNGLFNWIYVGNDLLGRRILVADRNIQQSISWNSINLLTSGTELIQHEYVTPVAYSGTVYSGYSYTSVSDNNSGTVWLSRGAGGNPSVDIINFDYGVIKNITRFILTGTAYSCKDFDIRYSDNNSIWTVASSGTLFNTSLPTTFDFTSVGEHRYWSIYIKNTHSARASSGLVEVKAGIKIETKSYKLLLRLPTGGLSATDTNNEWDNIITNSTLGGKITAGDNSIWNWSGLYSWTSSIPTANSANKVVRGNTLANTFYSIAPTTISTTYGFRPILIVEKLLTIKYLIQDGTELETINGSNLVTVCNTTDDSTTIESAFVTSGLSNLSTWSNSLTSQIVNNTFKVAIYRKIG